MEYQSVLLDSIPFFIVKELILIQIIYIWGVQTERQGEICMHFKYWTLSTDDLRGFDCWLERVGILQSLLPLIVVIQAGKEKERSCLMNSDVHL